MQYAADHGVRSYPTKSSYWIDGLPIGSWGGIGSGHPLLAVTRPRCGVSPTGDDSKVLPPFFFFLSSSRKVIFGRVFLGHAIHSLAFICFLAALLTLPERRAHAVLAAGMGRKRGEEEGQKLDEETQLSQRLLDLFLSSPSPID